MPPEAPQVVDTSWFGQMLSGIINHPTATILVLTLIALGYLYRARETERKENDAAKQKLNDDHKETIAKVIPVAEKLSDAAVAVEKSTAALERLMERAERLMEHK